MNANVGIPHSSKRRKTSCPSFPMASDCSRFDRYASAERSAPAAKINGLPMIAIAAGERPIASLIAPFRAASDCGPGLTS